MKKTPKKLSLSVATVRALTPNDLRHVAGAISGTWSGCSACDYPFCYTVDARCKSIVGSLCYSCMPGGCPSTNAGCP